MKVKAYLGTIFANYRIIIITFIVYYKTVYSMNEPKKVVLVPWDFTEGSEIALKHAIQLTEVSDNDILLLHIIPNTWFMRIIGRKTTSPQEVDALTKRLEKIAEDISNEIKV